MFRTITYPILSIYFWGQTATAPYLMSKFYVLLLANCFVVSVLWAQQSVSFNIKTDQFGYVPAAQKVAVISRAVQGYNAPETFTPGSTYEVRRSADNSTMFTGSIVSWNNGLVHDQSGDVVWHFDFSSVTEPGSYYIYDATNRVRSVPFHIDHAVYNELLKQAVRVYYYQRSGVAKPARYTGAAWADEQPSFVSAEQDLDCRLVTNPVAATSKNLSGGWFDAGDFNKYTNFCYGVLHPLLDAYAQNSDAFGDNNGIPESGNGVPDLLDELRWELEWLRKMQQDDGSVLMKVSVVDFGATSPPSADRNRRRYGAAANSAARVVSSIFAHAALVYRNTKQPALVSYADTLLQLAERSWRYLENNPAISKYDNAGFQSANPEMSEYDQQSVQTCAAVYLFAATGQTKYRDFFDSRYQNLHAMQWQFWYQYESTYQDAIGFYCSLPDATPAVCNTIRSRWISSVSSNPQNLKAFTDQTDAYRAFMKTNDYVWGSNQNKAQQGTIFYNMLHYNVDVPNHAQYRNAAAAQLHYLHGVNPNGLVYLTNTNVAGAERSATQMYHNWFGHGSRWDQNPPPGYLTGGANRNYKPAQGTLTPPQNQPVQKSYLDWNTAWPENSWEITEPAIYYQAAYIKLLSKFAGPAGSVVSVTTPVTQQNLTIFNVFPNPANQQFTITIETEGQHTIRMRDTLGRQLFFKETNEKQIVISTIDFPKTSYWIEVDGMNKQIFLH
jgi:endoglucanase